MIAGSHLLGQHCGFLCKCRICATLAPSLTPPMKSHQKNEEKKLAMQYEQEHIVLKRSARLNLDPWTPHNFWSIVLDDHDLKRIFRPKMIDWSVVIIHSSMILFSEVFNEIWEFCSFFRFSCGWRLFWECGEQVSESSPTDRPQSLL